MSNPLPNLPAFGSSTVGSSVVTAMLPGALPFENRLPADLPRLTALEQELDTSPEAFGELESASHLLNDAEALRVKMREDGYLFLPGYLDRSMILAARDEVAARLEADRVLDPRFPREELVLGAETPRGVRPDLAKENAPLMRALYSGPMMAFYEQFFGGAVRHYDYTWFRAVVPGQSTPPHMDIVYMGRGTHELLTAWTPLCDISLEMGGLMVLEKSHLHERLNKNYAQRDVDLYCVNKTGNRYAGTGAGKSTSNGWLSKNPVKLRANLGGRWLTAQFRAGDLLTFSMKTIHASISNATNRIRISTDSRYQSADAPLDERWIGENPIAHGPEAKRGVIC